MDTSTGRRCPRRQARQVCPAMRESSCDRVLNGSTDQRSHHFDDVGTDRILALSLNTPCTPSHSREHAPAIDPLVPCLLSSSSCPSSFNNTTTCSCSSPEGETERFTKVPVVSEYIEATCNAASRSDSMCGTLRVRGHRNKTNLELETREFLRSFRLRDGQWNEPTQDSVQAGCADHVPPLASLLLRM